ncbi:MAG: 5-(carboxyamino)imidazole ribonucleotide synthase [Burkholderiaceae bacterium]
MLGVMGGGQLGRMFVHAAQRMGYATAVLDPDAASPAGRVSHLHVQTDYLDPQGLTRMAQQCAAITTEFENVPAEAMLALAVRLPVAPSAAALGIAQDRAREKAHFAACNIPCAPYAVISNEEQMASVDAALLPGILKTARLGYDGKGQVRVRDRAELAAAWSGLRRVACVLEQLQLLQAECSVIVARGWDGAMVHFAPQRNLHRAGILAVTEAFEGNLPAGLAEQAVTAARAVAEGLQYVGVLCVEFFMVQGRLLVNEIAPRPHNSGHYTIDACDQSQFDLQVRTLAGLPLVQPRQHSPAIMLNLLGDLWLANAAAGQAQTGARMLDAASRGQVTVRAGHAGSVSTDGVTHAPDWAAVLALPGTHLHLYGKLDPRAGRKMGHLTITGDTVAQVRTTTAAAAKLLGLPLDEGS